MRRLLALPYSPWSERARWSLDHHRVRYAVREYLPMLGEPLLRLRLGRLRGPVTVPVLFDEGRVFTDSLAIARHADTIGEGPSLFPPGYDEEIQRWNERSESALSAGRALVANRTALDPAARRDSLPAFIPVPLRSVAVPLVSLGIRHLRRKYGFGPELDEGFTRTIVATLDSLRQALGGRDTLLTSGFSYADVTMAVALQFVRPPVDAYIRLAPAARRCWTDTALSERFADLCEWRDRIYARYR